MVFLFSNFLKILLQDCESYSILVLSGRTFIAHDICEVWRFVERDFIASQNDLHSNAVGVVNSVVIESCS